MHSNRSWVGLFGACSVIAAIGHVDQVHAAATTVYAFSAATGDRVSGVLEASDGNVYATTLGGGSSNAGAVIKVDGAGSVSVLHSFTGADGAEPAGGLVIGPDGAFYGTTASAGASGYGTVFRMTPGGTLTTLHSFTLDEGGASHAPLLAAADGNFYGVTSGVYKSGPPAFQVLSYGAVFRMTPRGDVTTLHRFNGADGAQPLAALIQASDGALYGTTSALQDTFSPHPTNISWGSVFRITVAGVFTSLHTFTGNDGGNPLGALLQAPDGQLYGTTSFATEWQNPGTPGSVFRISTSGALTTLFTFNSGDAGSAPKVGLVEGDDGNFYGTTSRGGANGAGSLFRITPAGALRVVHAFSVQDDGPGWTPLAAAADGGWLLGTQSSLLRISQRGRVRMLARVGYQNGAAPSGGVILATDGNFYGTTQEGGQFGAGVVYRLAPNGALRVLYSFAPAGAPYRSTYPSALIQGSDGAFYGTTSYGGTGFGTIFRVTTSGRYTELYVFDDSGSFFPQAALTQTNDGRLYGTTLAGGADGAGTAFRFNLRNRSFELLHAFSLNDPAGSQPSGPLLRAANGDLYGTSSSGGAELYFGTIFRITPAGEVSAVHTFGADHPEGASPSSGVTEGPDGTLYVSASSGGAGSGGTVFALGPDGSLRVLHAFQFQDSVDGTYPRSPLLLGAAGQLYGATSYAGPLGGGTIFRLAPDGTLTSLLAIPQAADGTSQGASGVIRGPDGGLYGTSQFGGAGAAGTVFRLDPL
jgi:uncharacterized repeat protein (TIGR03803 family)